MCVYYHGTSKENADLIIKEGFKEGTYFTWDLHSALVMGGMYIFGIFFEDKDISNYWEWRNSKVIHPDKILYLRKFDVECLYDNEIESGKATHKNHKKYFKEFFKIDVIFCEKCKGRGQLNNQPKYGGWGKEKCIVCPDCKGHGCLEMDGTKIE